MTKSSDQMTKESFDAWDGQEIFLFSKASRLAFGASSKPPIQLEPWAPSAEIKWLAMKLTSHSFLCSAEGKNGCITHTVPHTSLYDVVSDSFMFNSSCKDVYFKLRQ